MLAGLLILPGTLAVAFCRRQPLAAAATLLTGSVGGWLLTGSMVRCGALLPASFWIACAGGLLLPRRRSIVILALITGSIVVQTVSDPDIPPVTLILMLPVATGFWAMGRLLHSRNRALADIRRHDATIIETRRRSAELAVASDRARIAEGVVADIGDRIAAIQSSAERLRLRPADAGTASALAGIAADGRAVLTSLRVSVGALRAVEETWRYGPDEDLGRPAPRSSGAVPGSSVQRTAEADRA